MINFQIIHHWDLWDPNITVNLNRTSELNIDKQTRSVKTFAHQYLCIVACHLIDWIDGLKLHKT